MKHRAYLGIGSNIEPHIHIIKGLDEIAHRYELLAVSGVVESGAVGFDGAPFLNLAICVETICTLPVLARQLRQIEFSYGRSPDCSKFSSRTLDIDILTYDDLHGEHAGILLPRPEITRNAFVLGPLAEIAPNLQLAGTSLTIRDIWHDFDKAQQPLRPVDIVWQDQLLGGQDDLRVAIDPAAGLRRNR